MSLIIQLFELPLMSLSHRVLTPTHEFEQKSCVRLSYLVHAADKCLFALRDIKESVFFDFSRKFTQNCNVFADGARHLLELGIVGNELLDVANAIDILEQTRARIN